jgi:hypothetical protein
MPGSRFSALRIEDVMEFMRGAKEQALKPDCKKETRDGNERRADCNG